MGCLYAQKKGAGADVSSGLIKSALPDKGKAPGDWAFLEETWQGGEKCNFLANVLSCFNSWITEGHITCTTCCQIVSVLGTQISALMYVLVANTERARKGTWA